jgi:hypothetical protein
LHDRRLTVSGKAAAKVFEHRDRLITTLPTEQVSTMTKRDFNSLAIDQAPSPDSGSASKADCTSRTFRGVLLGDHWRVGERELSMVPSDCIAEINRASTAIQTIARLVHNSLCEPDMSDAEPLGQSAHLGLLSAVEIIGTHLDEVANAMRESGIRHAEYERVRDGAKNE